MTTTIDRGSIAYSCGCVNRTDDPSGVMRSEHKCAKHKARQREVSGLGQAYYEELGTLKNGEPWDSPHVGELVEALGPLPEAPLIRKARKYRERFGENPPWPDPSINGIALEFGCGVSPYVRAIREAGYRYIGVDQSLWACQATERASGEGKEMVRCSCGDFTRPGLENGPHADFILAAHVLEHLPDAPGGIRKCADLLAPGGELWIVVPDDSDPLNPDHLFFFTPDTLRGCVERSGLEVIREATRRHVPHERFLYCRARKPV